MKPRFIEKIADQPRYFAESKLPAERGDRFFLIRQGPGEKGVDSLFFVDPGDRLRDDREGWIERNLRAVSLEETGAKRIPAEGSRRPKDVHGSRWPPFR